MKKECEANEIEVGKIYKFSLKNIPLYFAKIEDAGGCWSKIIVTELCESIYKKNYFVGQRFDIKTAQYEYEEIN